MKIEIKKRQVGLTGASKDTKPPNFQGFFSLLPIKKKKDGPITHWQVTGKWREIFKANKFSPNFTFHTSHCILLYCNYRQLKQENH